MGKFRSNSELSKDYEKAILWLHNSRDGAVAELHRCFQRDNKYDFERGVTRLNNIEFVLDSMIKQYGDIKYNINFKLKRDLAWFNSLGLKYPYSVEDFENLPKE